MIAQSPMGGDPFVLVALAGLLGTAIIMAIVFALRYRKCGPNEAMIITGMRRRFVDPRTHGNLTTGFRIRIGGGAFIMPILETCHVLSLEPVILDIREGGTTARLQVRIGRDEASICAAAERFLSKSPDEIRRSVEEVIRQHLAQHPPSEVEEEIQNALRPLGMELLSFRLI